jgi:hypothetical protein
MFRLIIQELLNIEHFFQIKALKKKFKLEKLGQALDIVGKPLMSCLEVIS